MSSGRPIAYVVLTGTTIVGGLSLLLFGFFLFGNSFAVADLRWGGPAVLAWDSLLCVMFFSQHSIMIRRSFRRRLTVFVPYHFHGALYTIASGAVLIFLVLFWQSSGAMLVHLKGPVRWAADGIFFLSLLGMIWSMRALRAFDMFGIQPILANIRAGKARSMPLTIRGPYRWVRHPLYFCILVLLWFRPEITLDRLLFNVLFTVWIVIGTLLEERDLVADFDAAYVNYQRKVPMLIPWKVLAPFTPNRVSS